jgi:hypothetical protein
MSSKYACSVGEFVSWYSKLKKFGVNKYMIGTFLGILGIFFVLFGQIYFKISSFFVIAVCSGLVFKSLISPYIQIDFAIALILGMIYAYLTYDFIYLLNITLSVIIGFIIGNMLYYNFTMKLINMRPETLYLITIVLCIVIIGLITCYIESLIIIVATSIVGAYLAIRGLSICTGGYPDETYLTKLVTHKEFNQIARIFGGKAYIFLFAIIILFIIGIAFQSGLYLRNKKDDEKKNEEKKTDEKDNLIKNEEVK